ncbi:hypothetical protein GCM10027404_05620 [Arthrobacter tumbae]|uniref:aquaporin n=1 Tax=Arthrobacter tumbae TaxID=163874 RepID=UPI00195D8267|nr:aquaporin [Arthrobacter tumbae]MBM7779995.1 aquaporin Z [Arthrobacter tumbae]
MHPISQEAPSTDTGYDDNGPGLLTGSLLEALGSFLLVLGGLGVTMLNPQAGIAPGVAFGLALAAAIAAFGRLSGGYFNPAVTLGLAMAGRLAWRPVLPFVMAQVLGGLAASGLFWVIFSAHPQDIQTTGLFSAAANGYAEHSSTQFPIASVLLIEVAAAALLTAVVLGSTGRSLSRAAAPFAIGLGYAVLLTMLAPIDNGAINPARSTATALFAEPWAAQQLWLFWLAPLLGALIAGLLYRSFELATRSGHAESTPANDPGTPDTTDTAAGSAAAAATLAARRDTADDDGTR